MIYALTDQDRAMLDAGAREREVMRETPEEVAHQLTPQQRVLLFCIASGTDWKPFKIRPPTVQLTILKNLTERPEHQKDLVVSDLGLAVLDVLLRKGPR